MPPPQSRTKPRRPSRRKPSLLIVFSAGLALGVLIPVYVIRHHPPAVAAAPLTIPLSPYPPQDIALPSSPAEVGDFAWKLFIALNWPVAPGQRGIPDSTRHIGDSALTVWQSFKSISDVFTQDGKDPGPWNPGDTPQPILLDQTSKATQRELQLSEIKQAIGGPLTDQHGNLTFYQKAANVISYDFIRENKLYTATGQASHGPVVFPFGAIEVKAAWRVMTADDNQSRYYTMPALIPGTHVHDSVTVGLVGLHIIIKTPNAPSWIWTTFEQVDNVPGPAPGAAPWSYNNPASTTPPNKQTPPGTPAQVTRVNPDLPIDINYRWQHALQDTPWQYYQLIGAQFPQANPQPDQLANVVMETYIQPQSSCIDCHSTAKTLAQQNSDFSFLLLDASSPPPAPASH